MVKVQVANLRQEGMLRKGGWCMLGYDERILKAEDLNQRVLGKIKPWQFIPKHFELYNVKEDREQDIDFSAEHPEIVAAMKGKMMKLREELTANGRVW